MTPPIVTGKQTERERLQFTLTKTNFVKGDTIRLRLRIVRNTQAAGKNYSVYFDPENTAVGGEDSTLILSLPMLTAKG